MNKRIFLAVLVSALGYFVDVYDLVIFNVVRVKSLQSLHLSESEITSVGLSLLNTQLIGLLVGGLLWGVLGDKKGRVSVLFGSIFLYSCANIANAFVTDVTSYSICRFLTGIGLGGEFGVGVTLVSELMPKERRGYGTMIVAITGIFGAIASGLTGDYFSWQTSYIVGGLMGFALLALRIGLSESLLFEQVKASSVSRGSLKLLLSSPPLLRKYLKCIAVGAPIWLGG
jgi:putative MFS transporter